MFDFHTSITTFLGLAFLHLSHAADPCFKQTGVILTDIEGTTFPVQCSDKLNGGGWVEILKRFDGSVDFGSPEWNDYAHSLQGELSG